MKRTININTSKSLLIALLLVSTQAASANAQDEGHHWLLPNHPRLRRIFKAAGIGAATGGLAAPLLGASVAGGAAAGAGEHATLRGLKDHHDSKHRHKLDSHIW